MHRAWPVIWVAALLLLSVPAAAAVGLTINATPREPRIGDPVILSGTVTGIKTIAVYLFVTGPGLDPRGVTLDNLNIPTGRGLFTTAPVNMEDGTWSYTWDTSVIIGTMTPGTYTVHVVASPVQRIKAGEGDTASVQVSFLPEPVNTEGAPLDPAIPVAACVAAILFVSGTGRLRK